MTDQVPANINLRLALEQAALQQGKQGIADVQKQFDTLKTQIQDTGKSADSALAGIAKSSGGLGDVLQEDVQNFQKLNAEVSKSNSLLSSLRTTGRALDQLGLGNIGHAVQVAGDVGIIGKELGEGAEAAAAGLSSVGISLTTVTAVAAPLVAALVAVSLAQQNYANELKKGEALLDAALSAEEKYYGDVQHLTTDAAKKRLSQEEADQKTLEKIAGERRDAIIRQATAQGAPKAFIEQFMKTGDSSLLRSQDYLKELFKAYDDVNKKLSESQQYSTRLAQGLEQGAFKGNDVVGVVNDIFTTITKGAEKAVAAVQQHAKLEYDASQQFNKAFSDDMEERRKAAEKAREEQQQQLNQALAATEKYNDAVKAANEHEGQQKVEIQQKYAGKVADVLQKAIDVNSAALQKLQDRQRELLTGATREDEKQARQDELEDVKLRIKERRTERDDLVQHLQKVRDIENQFRSGERDAILDRNFAQLFKLQESKKDQQKAEDQAYSETRAQHRQQLVDEKQDMALQRASERNERRIALANALADARAGYLKELEQSRQAKQKALELAAQERDSELRLVAQKRNETLKVLADGYAQELKLAFMTSQERQRLLIAEMNQVRAMGYRVPSSQAISQSSPYTSLGSTGGVIRRFADGGNMQAGEAGIVNEPGSTGNEGFTSGGRSIRFPGTGMFIAAQSGTVNKNAGGSPVVNLTIQTAATDPREVGRIARREVLSGLKKVGVG